MTPKMSDTIELTRADLSALLESVVIDAADRSFCAACGGTAFVSVRDGALEALRVIDHWHGCIVPEILKKVGNNDADE